MIRSLIHPHPVRNHFSDRELLNPLGTSTFGFRTLGDAEPEGDMEEAASAAFEGMNIKKEEKTSDDDNEEVKESVNAAGAKTSGAAGKFRKKDKKKKKKKNF